ncbi:Hpt domain-containing protein [Flagellimonas crocea]|uniref:Hpt domain-containing protein n=1 Tax=Flagellimonas crocea TaxID=3067311 RepID=UPI00296F7947|nr:Hpt domain-containing protein [Muricauda sp. DH64]
MGTTIEKVLFISPNSQLLEAFNNFDISRNWEMESCQDSFDALQQLKNTNFDLVVMDHKIGPLDPFKLMDYVFHELQKYCPMVIVGDGSEPEAVHENYIRFNYPIEQHNIDTLVFNTNKPTDSKEEQLFSLDYLNELSDNDPEFLLESLQLFQDTLDSRLNDLKMAVSESNINEARQIAHNIKPSFAMLGNGTGRALCQTICYDATNEEIPELSQVLMNEYELIINEIKKQFPKLNAE